MKGQKIILQLVAVLCLMSTISCIKTTEILSEQSEFLLDLPTISSITLDMPATVHITQGPTQSIHITAQQEIFDLLTKSVDNENWRIALPSGVYKYGSINIEISLQTLTELSNTSTGDIIVNKPFTNLSQLLLLSDGTGLIKFNGQAQAIDLQMEGTGDIELAGNTELLTINNQGLGKIIAYDLASKEAAITTDATGDIFVFVQDVLQVTMDGIGDVFYKGQPTIESAISGIGELINAN